MLMFFWCVFLHWSKLLSTKYRVFQIKGEAGAAWIRLLSQGASWTMGWNPTQSPKERESPLGKVQASRLLLYSPEASQLAVCWGKGGHPVFPPSSP